jgi:hypothetical protein
MGRTKPDLKKMRRAKKRTGKKRQKSTKQQPVLGQPLPPIQSPAGLPTTPDQS